MNTQFLFQAIHVVNQLPCSRSSDELVSTFRIDRKKRNESICLRKEILSRVSSDLLLQRHLQIICLITFLSFKVLSVRIQYSQLYEKTHFQLRVSEGKKFKTGSDQDDGTGSIVLLCREYTFSWAHPQSRVCASNLDGTIIGSVNEVRIDKILQEDGLKISTPSISNPWETSFPMISREATRFSVDEIHDHEKELRSSNELIIQKGNNVVEKKDLIALMKFKLLKDGKETCANPLSHSISHSSLKKRSHFFLMKGNGSTIDVNPSRGGYLSTQISKMITKMIRHHDQDEQEQDGSYHWEIGKSKL